MFPNYKQIIGTNNVQLKNRKIYKQENYAKWNSDNKNISRQASNKRCDIKSFQQHCCHWNST